MIDEFGAKRHIMTSDELNALYKQFENFIADCTSDEVSCNREAINTVLTMIHQRLINRNK